MLKTILKALCIFTLAGLMLLSPLPSAQGKQFVLVDHSLYSQSITGMPQAKVLAVLDHHTMGDIKNANPITYITKPIGATASVVFYEFEAQKVKISQPIAGLLLSAICSDTIGLKN